LVLLDEWLIDWVMERINTHECERLGILGREPSLDLGVWIPLNRAEFYQEYLDAAYEVNVFPSQCMPLEKLISHAIHRYKFHFRGDAPY
jgi:hypothetical protein